MKTFQQLLSMKAHKDFGLDLTQGTFSARPNESVTAGGSTN